MSNVSMINGHIDKHEEKNPERDRLIELLDGKSIDTRADIEYVTDFLLEKGVIVPPCKVGDIVWDTEGNAWKIFAITIWEDCIGLKTANSKDIRKTFTIGKRSIGKTVFLTKEEALSKLQASCKQVEGAEGE